jgi:hypothetical protein
MRIHVQCTLMYSRRERGVEALGESFRNRELVGDDLELRIALQTLLARPNPPCQLVSPTARRRRGQTLRSLARKVIKSAHSLTWSKECSVLSTSCPYLRHLGSAWRAFSCAARAANESLMREGRWGTTATAVVAWRMGAEDDAVAGRRAEGSIPG